MAVKIEKNGKIYDIKKQNPWYLFWKKKKLKKVDEKKNEDKKRDVSSVYKEFSKKKLEFGFYNTDEKIFDECFDYWKLKQKDVNLREKNFSLATLKDNFKGFCLYRMNKYFLKRKLYKDLELRDHENYGGISLMPYINIFNKLKEKPSVLFGRPVNFWTKKGRLKTSELIGISEKKLSEDYYKRVKKNV